MRICFLTLDFPPFRSSGLTIYSERIVKGLAARGHVIQVVAAARPDDQKIVPVISFDGISVVRVPTGGLDWIGFGWQSANYLHRHKGDFDVVHFADIHFAYAYRGAFTATGHQSFRQRLTSHHGFPYCVNLRDCLFRLVYYNLARWTMEQPALHRASHLVMVSETTRREFTEHYRVEPERTSVVYNSVDLDRLKALPVRNEALKRIGLNLSSDLPILLYVGFSTPRKGLEYLAQALQLMQSPACLIIVGKWDSNYLVRFLRVIDDLGSMIHIVGYVNDTMLLNYFAIADVFVLPSLLEGFGIPLAEAMAAGIPVVTTKGGAASEVVGEAGVTVPPADSYALAVALDKVLSDQALARHMSKIGRVRAFNLFDPQKVALKMERIFQRFSNDE